MAAARRFTRQILRNFRDLAANADQRVYGWRAVRMGRVDGAGPSTDSGQGLDHIADWHVNPARSDDTAVLRIGTWRVDPALDEISREGQTVRLEPLAMRLLVCLARQAGRPIALQRLLDEVWAGVVVTPGSVYQAIAQLRRTLGDSPEHPTYIETVPRKGYRLIAPVMPWAGDRVETDPSHAGRSPEGPSLPETESALAATTGGRALWQACLLPATGVLAVVLIAGLAWHARTPQPAAASIAILPFVDLSESHDKEYFADGLAEELIGLLKKIPNLKVVARTSSFRLRGHDHSVRDVGEALGVAYVLEGSVREAGARLRINAQLIRTDSERAVWSKTYEPPNADVFKTQDMIATDIIQALRIVADDDALFQSRAVSWEAYQAFLRARFLENWNTENDADRAVAAYHAAVAIDPTFAPAWVGLADVLLGQWIYFGTNNAKVLAEARAAAHRAVALDPSLAAARVTMADVYARADWDWDRAEQEAEIAQRLAPGNSAALNELSYIAIARGDWERSAEFARRALAVDPLSGYAHVRLAIAVACGERLTESEREFRKALELDPLAASAIPSMLGIILMRQGRLREALEIANQDRVESWRLWSVATIQQYAGRESDSASTLEEMQRHPEGNEDGIAWVYAAQGRLDEAFAWFEKAYALREYGLLSLKCAQYMPREFLRDPRYKALLRRVNLPE